MSMFKKKSVRWSMLGLVIVAIFTTVALTNVTSDPKMVFPKGISFPEFVKASDFDKINWDRTAQPLDAHFNKIGNRNKSAVIGMNMPSLTEQKWMWILWGVENVDLTIVGYHKETKTVHPILSPVMKSPSIWTLENLTLNGTDARSPSMVKVPMKGDWAILLYTDGLLFDILVHEIKQ